MRKMAVAILHDDDLAADAVQDTLVTLWQRRWRLGLIKERQGYCMRTIQHRCIDIIRDQKKVGNIDNEAFGIELPLLSDIDRTEALYHKLEESIASLTPQQQKIIELKYVKQLGIHDIAQQTGLSETNITTVLSRAYATLRKKMDMEDE
ncbi:MAG: sigma-70 family RNA polymerase sigma factor [Bacteroidales bacterium]|nr:sigma-70 family RNA polymerase sigma factor [Bacteroidales bacterium]